MHQYIRERVAVTESGCWEWQLRLNRTGYGACSWRGATGVLAHRVSWELHVGPIPAGLTIHHQCFNPACVNPEHLELLTLSENARLQRSAQITHCPQGHPYDESNTYIRPGKGNGRRTCRACNRESQRRYKSRKAAA